jgi:PST family polysaccharide transporter
LSLKRQAISGAAWAAADTCGRQAVSFLVFVVLARLLTPGDLGLFALILVFYAVMQCLVDDGIGETLVQRAALDPAHLSTAFWTNLGIAVLVAGLGAGGAALVAQAIGQPALTPLVAAQGLVLVTSAMGGVHQALLRRELRFRDLAMRTWTAIVLAGLVGVSAALAGWGIWALFAQQLTERTVSTLMLWRAGGWRPALHWSPRHARDLAGYTLRTVASRLVIVGYNQVDRLVIAALLGSALLGHYALATRITDTLTTALIISMSTAAFSAFARIQDSPEHLRRAYHGTLQAMMLVVAPAFLGLAAVAPTLVATLFGARWVEAGPALALLALTGLPILIMSICGVVLRATGRPGLFLVLVASGAVGNLAAAVVGARWGLSGVAGGMALRQYLFVPVMLWLGWRCVGASPWRVLADMVPALAGVAVMLAAVLGVRAEWGAQLAAGPQLALEIAAGGLGYVAGLALTGRRALRQVIGLVRPQGLRPSA